MANSGGVALSHAHPRQICTKLLGKGASRKYLSIINDIKCVSCGLKPSLLYDYGSASGENLRDLIDSFKTSGIIAQDALLCIVTVDEDVFVCNIPAITMNLTTEMTNRTFIDISSYCSEPCLITKEEIARNILELQQEIELADPKVTHEVNKKGSKATEGNNLESYFKDFIGSLDELDAIKGTPTFNLNLPESVNRTTVFGLFLGYPVVYWYNTKNFQRDSSVQSGNCLGMVPLRVYRIFGTHCKRDISSNKDHKHAIYYFSCPDSLTAEIEDSVLEWVARIKKLPGTCMFDALSYIATEVVTLPCVSL